MEIRKYYTQDTYSKNNDLTGSWTNLLKDGFGQLSLVEIAPYTMLGWSVHGDRNEWYIGMRGSVLVCEAGGQAVPADGTAIFIPNCTIHGLYNGGPDMAWLLVYSDQPHEYMEDEIPVPVRAEELDALQIIFDNAYPDITHPSESEEDATVQ